MSHPQTKESLFSVTYSTILLTVNTCISNYSKSYYVQKMNQDVYQHILLTDLYFCNMHDHGPMASECLEL